MKYTITLNQNIMIEHGINVSKMAILDVLSIAPTWSESTFYKDDVFYWVSRSKIVEELKAFDLKEDTVYRYLKELDEMGFIEYVKLLKKDLIRLTNKGKSLFINSEKNPNYDENSEKNPTKLGKKSEFNSEKNPTYKDTNNNKLTNNKIDTKRFTPPTLEDVQSYIKEKSLNVNAKDFFDYYDVSGWVDAKGQKVKNWKQKLLTWNNRGFNNNGKPKQKETQRELIDRVVGGMGYKIEDKQDDVIDVEFDVGGIF